MNYWGSCAELKTDLTKYGKENFTREILEVCYNKKYLTYREMEFQVLRNVLRTNSYNANILARYFRKDMINKPNIQ